jgi:hypothetical protein
MPESERTERRRIDARLDAIVCYLQKNRLKGRNPGARLTSEFCDLLCLVVTSGESLVLSAVPSSARSNCAGVNRRQKNKMISVHRRSQCSGGGISIIVSYRYAHAVSARDKESFPRTRIVG